MIGKLIKYEWKATYRVFLLLYLAVMLISILSYGGLQWGNEIFRNLSTVAISMGMISVIAIYFTGIFNGFIKSIYGDEGYLTHTLPVKAREILLCKSIMASFWGIITLIVVVICGLSLLISQSLQGFNEAMEGVKYLFELIGLGNFIIITVMVLASAIQLLIKIFFSIAVSKLPIITRFQGFVGLIVFVFCTYVQNKLYSAIVNYLGMSLQYENIKAVDYADVISQVLNSFGIFHMIFTIVIAAIYFVATCYILEKKFNIR